MSRSIIGKIVTVNERIDAFYSDLSETLASFGLDDVITVEQVNDQSIQVKVLNSSDLAQVENLLETALSASFEEEEYTMANNKDVFLIGLNTATNTMLADISSLKKEQEDEDGEYDEEEEEETDDDEEEIDSDDEEEDSETVKKIKGKKEKNKEEKDSKNTDKKLEKPSNPEQKNKEEKRKVLAVLNTDVGFKMATSLYGMACGKDRSHFPSFVQDLDDFIQDYRKGSGYTGEDEQIQGYQKQEVSDFMELMDIAFDQSDRLQDVSKKEPKFKEGRAGLLSAMMGALSGKAGDSIIESWNSGDVETLMDGLGKAIEKVVEKLVELHPSPKLPPEEDSEEK
jgi:hypothetical protein